jgi:subtilisin-like proprotein convertase family protein
VENGIANGRGGLGTIYVWAAGNGRSANDNVNYDGYASSRYTIAVGATGGNGVFSSYSEPGASMLVNSPSSYSGAGTTTVDLVGSNGYNNSSDYTDDFGGTSSACPLAAGVIALILEANPNLTWRDVQHILVQTSEKNDPGNSDWTTNGAGLEFNHNYGFGRTDASAAVAAAETWTTVPDNEAPLTASSSSVISIPESVTGAITASDSVSISAPAEFATEHVEVIFNATHTWRGDIAVSLTSPDGTVSRLSEPHLGDSANNYNNWMFTTVANWGENPNGTWTLTFYDGATGDTGNVTGWTLNVHGFLTTVPDSATQWESYD